MADLWHRTLRRRSQKDGFTWERMTSWSPTGLPRRPSFIYGPTGVSPLNTEVRAGCSNGLVRILCAGGVRQWASLPQTGPTPGGLLAILLFGTPVLACSGGPWRRGSVRLIADLITRRAERKRERGCSPFCILTRLSSRALGSSSVQFADSAPMVYRKVKIATMLRKTKRRDPVAVPADSPLMVNSVHKAFRVLMAFTRTEPRLTLSQIAEKLKTDKSTAQRFTHTLLTLGYLEKDPVTRTLGATVKVLDLAHIYLATNPLVAAAVPYLLHLNQETRETVNLTVLDGTDVVFVSRILGKHLLSTGVIIGTRLPAYTTGSGLAMMSQFADSEIKRLLNDSQLRPFTPDTVYEPAKVLERLKSARTKGYAISVGDYFTNDISIGSPIVSRSGKLLGAISLAVSADRFTPKDAETKFAKLVAAAARSVPV